jgi:Ca-activated chloride channel family protein
MNLLLASTSFRFGAPEWLPALVLVPVLVLLLSWGLVRRRKALREFAGRTPSATEPSAARGWLKVALVGISLTCLVLALSRPQTDPQEEQVTLRGRDIVFLLDVSRSMLSKDVSPSRMERSKLWINDLTNSLSGDRIGLVAFAGASVVKCPLTLDYGFFRMALDELSPRSVPRGGTLIGDAIRKTMSDVLDPSPSRFRDIILITDGEDHESFPAQAAAEAGAKGIRIITIGIGSDSEGSLVPSDTASPDARVTQGSNGYVEHDGIRVRSKLDTSTLAHIAAASAGGVFLNVGTGTIDLEKVYQDLIATADKNEVETKVIVNYRELFPWLLGAALIGLFMEVCIPERKKVRGLVNARMPVAEPRHRRLSVPASAAACVALFFLPIATEHAMADTKSSSATPNPPTAVSLYNEGRDLFANNQFAEAADRFRSADLATSNPDLASRTRFNLGLALLRQAKALETQAQQPPQQPAQAEEPPNKAAQSLSLLKSAADTFRSCLDINPNDVEAARNVEIARRLMKDIQEKQEKFKPDGQKQQQGDKSDPSKSDSKDQQNNEHQQNADQLKDLAKKQSEAADKSKEAQQSQSQEQHDHAQQQSKFQQDEVNKQTEKQQSEQNSSAAKDKLDQARKEQQAASEALEKNDPKSAEEHQRKAAEMLDQASKDEQKAAEEQAAKQKNEQSKAQPEKDQKAQDQKAQDQKTKFNETANQLLDKERRQRDQRQQVLRALRGKPQPVDKDW